MPPPAAPLMRRPTDALGRPPRVLVAMAYWMESIYAGIASRARDYGWALDDTLRWQRELPGEAGPWDGVIVYAHRDLALVTRLRALGLPLVDLQDYAGHFDAPVVSGDDYALGTMGGSHLVSVGCQSLVFINPDPTSSVTRRRLAGFVSTARPASVTVTECPDQITALTAADHLPRPVGLFAASDQLAVECEREALARGWAIPGDLCILGTQNTPLVCEHAPVPVSSIDVDFHHKGEVAAELLQRLMAGDTGVPARTVVPPAGVVVRASTRRQPGGDEAFSRLTTVLTRDCGEALPLEALCARAGLTLRKARELVRDRCQRTLVDELARIRVERAKTLLLNTDLNMLGVATASGFGTRQALFLAFRRIEGRPPETFRNRLPSAR